MTTNDQFVHLHVHTEFSLLDGLSRIKKLVSRAKELNMPAVSITDHGVMFGVMDFYNTATSEGIKPIIGMEAYISPRGMEDKDAKLDRTAFHMLLLAKNDVGYQNLLKISSEGQLRGYYYRPRIDQAFLEDHSEGLIATSGCLAARIPRMIREGTDEQAMEWIGRYNEIFGDEHFYLELQEHDIDLQRDLNKWLIDYNRGNHSNVGLVASTDLHYVLESDFDIHDTLLCIQTGALKHEKDRMTFSDNSFYLSSYDEMMEMFGEVPEAVHNSVKIAEMCDVNLDRGEYHLPIFPVPEGHDSQTYLRYLCDIGMDWRFGDRKHEQVLRDRLDRELGIINDMGFNTYFLIVWDLCEFARHADIWWNVRGSGAGSLAAYCLGITNIDPIKNALLFERFLNPGRVSMPDIDLDYPDDRRGELIAYAANKYGEDKVAAIITFGTMGAKAAVRDVGRALDIPLADVNRAAGLIPQEAKQKKIAAYVEMIPDLKRIYDTEPKLREVLDTAKELQGISRHASTHAAGVIIADRPLVDYLPLHRITGKDPSGGSLKAVTQFPMETCEAIGLLKVDFLGLSTLTILRKAADLIEQYHGIKYTMDNIPYRHDDPNVTDEQKQMLDKAFELMGRGETVGVFQLESSGMQQMLRGMRPKVFENIIAGISLYRPGPMEFIPQYNKRLHDEEETDYRHELLEPILKETYGIMVYQEQLMQIGGELFGYDLGEADLMRRAVSKKKAKDLQLHREIFLERGPKNGIDEDTAGKIFDDIEFFANYGFNKSHASDYAVITVQTAFLKAHYPEEFMTALLSVQRDDSNKVTTFLEECRRLSIPVLPPDVNYSMLDFAIQEDPESGKRAIRFGLAAIKNAGAGALQYIIDARGEGEEFTDLIDFCKRVDLRHVGKRALESLVKVGALVSFGKRSTLYNAIDRIASYSGDYHKDQEVGQMNMFGELGDMDDALLSNLSDAIEFNQREMLQWEKELLGLYVTGRPVDKFRAALAQTATMDVAELKLESQAYNGREVSVAGEIMQLRKIYTRKNDAMAVAVLEDWHDTANSIEVVLFPRTWERVLGLIASDELHDFDVGEVVMIGGKFDISRGDPQIIAETVRKDFETMGAKGQAHVVDDVAPNWADEEPPPPPATLQEPPEWLDADDSMGNLYDEETGEVIQDEVPAIDPEPVDVSVPTMPTGEVVPEPQKPTNGHTDHMDSSISTAKSPPTTAGMPDWAQGTDELEVEPFEAQDDGETHWIRVYFRRSGDDHQDRRRLTRLHGLLVSFPGQDRFTLVVERREGADTIEFPNDTTGYSMKLIEALMAIIKDVNDIEVWNEKGRVELVLEK